MESEAILTWTVFIGVFLSIIGVFLPWGKGTWPPGMYAGQDEFLGVQFLLGTITFISSVFAAVFFLLHMKRKMRGSSVLALLFGLIMFFCTLTWVLIPDSVGVHWGWWKYGLTLVNGYPLYIVFYGAYISFTGSILTLASMISLKFLTLQN